MGCKLLERDVETIQHVGVEIGGNGLPHNVGQGERDEGQYIDVFDMPSVTGAAMGIRADLWRRLGGLDEKFYPAYYEETDFCFRALMADYRVVFVPKSIVWHAFNTQLKKAKKYYTSYITRFLGCRNYIMTLLKNLSFGYLVRILPFHIFSWFVLSLLFFLRGKLIDSVNILKGISWNIFNLSTVIKKRSFVQKKIRKIEDKIIFKDLMKNQSLRFWFEKVLRYLKGTKY